MGREKSRRDKGKKDNKKDKSKKKQKKDKGRRRDRRKRESPSETDYEYEYSYYDYSDSRSPSPARRSRDRKRSRSRVRDRRDRHSSPPRKGGKGRAKGEGGFIPTNGPRSPSRDGSPPNNWIYNKMIDREKSRVTRDFAEADRIREELRVRGVTILERERRWEHTDGRSGARPNADDKKRDED
mmetsp:Transcript_54055/g.86007  ORF Transcript_54055/g.86007 Transcript_54055/m.86007 type:complete len:183 (+) Transcript_54055:102-650(+)